MIVQSHSTSFEVKMNMFFYEVHKDNAYLCSVTLANFSCFMHTNYFNNIECCTVTQRQLYFWGPILKSS